MSAQSHSPPRNLTVSMSKPARAIQVVQGMYYVVAGLLVALAIETIQGPADRQRAGAEMWLVRVVAVAAAGFGVALFLSGRRGGRGFVPAWGGMWVALLLLAQTSAAMAFGVLPLTFLLDAGVEGLFVAWWVVVMLARVNRQASETTPVTP